MCPFEIPFYNQTLGHSAFLQLVHWLENFCDWPSRRVGGAHPSHLGRCRAGRDVDLGSKRPAALMNVGSTFLYTHCKCRTKSINTYIEQFFYIDPEFWG